MIRKKYFQFKQTYRSSNECHLIVLTPFSCNKREKKVFILFYLFSFFLGWSTSMREEVFKSFSYWIRSIELEVTLKTRDKKKISLSLPVTNTTMRPWIRMGWRPIKKFATKNRKSLNSKLNHTSIYHSMHINWNQLWFKIVISCKLTWLFPISI